MVALGGMRNAYLDQRQAPRVEVYHRVRARVLGYGPVALQIVDISAGGYMARTEAELAPGASLSIRLPIVGDQNAEIRWALAGRIGCQFTRPLDSQSYQRLVAALSKEPG